jgi:eukaryotic-like serine/threonine-protein kinase
MRSDPNNSVRNSAGDEPRAESEGLRVCKTCNTPLTSDVAGEFCAVCMLRSAIGDIADTDGSFESSADSGFGHYAVELNEDGSTVELGRGAMGVTYKAFDTELRCPVALKVIGERHLGDPVVLRRFLREARAAASLRHPNVASVFHLGRTGGSYFYAMEFAEGETLERLVKRSGTLETALALDIASQVAAGLAAIHKQQLIHRDVKPANIMVSFEEGGAPKVKIIDLGLAKSLDDTHLESAISASGAFAGTPEFASPEQFLGAGVDIRSDLYSLGITLWDMVTGHVPFRGTPSEVMYQHRHRALPIEQLKTIPQPIAVLLDVLLEKNPKYRFQTPAELLEALETVSRAVRTGRRMIKTIRVNILASSDVQKERNLADRLMRSIAAEFNIPVSATELNFQRLLEVDLVRENGGPDGHWKEDQRVVLCPCFSRDEMPGREIDNNNISGASIIDLVVCIVWSRLDIQAKSALAEASCVAANPEQGVQITSTPADNISESEGLEFVVYRNCNNPTPPLEPKEARDEFGRRWDALQGFFADWEKDNPDGLAQVVNIYRSLQEFEEAFRNGFRRFLGARIGDQVRGSGSRRRVRRWHASPFRGLNLFSYEHAPIFCGRTKAIGEVLDAMEAQIRVDRPFVIVVGPSGSGKSSLVQAGVLPLLTQPGTIEGIGIWRRAVTRPGAGGSSGDCFDALAAALLEPTALPGLQNPESLSATRDLACELREHADSVALRVRDALDHAAHEWTIEHRHRLEEQERQFRASGRPEVAEVVRQRAERLQLPKSRLALVVDQLEELFTAGFSVEVRQDYVAAIAGLARSGRVHVLATLRSDFYSSYQQFPELIELTRPSGKVDLRRPAQREIGEIIRLPAEAAGLSFEQEEESGQSLDEALREAASETPESLPLLEHVLSLLYEEQAIRGDQILRWSDYRKLGELKGALAQHAERVFATLEPVEKDALPVVMRHLVTLGQGEEEVPNRRTVPYGDFIVSGDAVPDQKAGARGFVDLFVSKRLFVADTDPQGNVTISVAHEALLREWQRVKEWLAENREFLRMRDRLDSSLKLWRSRGRQKDDLLGPGLPLAEGEKLVEDFGPSLSREQTDFVKASISEQVRRKRIQDRFRYAVMATITVALVAAVIFGIVSFRQYRTAERAKAAANHSASRATVARSEAEKLINFMMTDLRDKVTPIGRLDLLNEVNRRVKAYYDNISRSDDGAEIQRQHSLALKNYGDVLFDQGARSEAGKLYREALVITQKLASENSKDPNFRADLAAIYQQIGNVFEAQGNIEEALKNYEESLALREKLVEQSPQNSEWQLKLSWSLQKVGLMLDDRGDLPGALKNFVRALNISNELHQQNPKNMDFRVSLWILNIRIGEVLEEEGEPDGALSYFRDSLAVAQELKHDSPNDTSWQRDVGISEEQIGDILSAEGDLEGAQREYAAAFSVRSALFAHDQTNGLWENDLALCYEDLGSISNTQGDFENALKMYRECLLHRTRLTNRDATDSQAQQDFAISKNKFGLVLLATGQFSAALESCTEALKTAQTLAERDEKNEEWQEDTAKATEGVGEVLKAEGKSVEALQIYQNALLIRKKLSSKGERWQKEVAWNEEEIGDALITTGDIAAAIEHCRTAVTLGESLVVQDYGDIEVRSNLAKSYEMLGEAFALEGGQVEALQNFTRSRQIFEELLRAHPNHADWESTTALICLDIANCLSKSPSQSSLDIRAQLEQGQEILLEKQKRFALGYADRLRLKEIQDRLH